MKSIIQTKKECYLCRRIFGADADLQTYGLEEHHCIPGTANRRKSEAYGLKVWLCVNHHRTGKNAVHNNPSAMIMIKQEAQRQFEKTYTRADWLREFGKNYL